MGSDPTNSKLSSAALRQLKSQLTAAEDDKLHRILELVDRLELRGEADNLIAPLRMRIARLKPKRNLNFARLLFTPFNPLIVDASKWNPDSPAIPRSAILAIAQQVQTAIAQQGNADSIVSPNLTADDLPLIVSLGRTLWLAAAEILRGATLPPHWSSDTGLRDRDYTALSAALQALLPKAAPLLQIAVDANAGTDPEPSDLLAMLQSIAPAGAQIPAMFIAMGLGWLPRTRLFVKAVDELASSRNNTAIAVAADKAVEYTLSGIEQSPAYAAGLATSTDEIRHAALILENLVASSADKPGRRQRIEQARQAVDTACRDNFTAEVASQLLEPCASIAAADSKAVEGFEDAARALRRYEAVAKKIGSTEFYDKQLGSAVQALRPRSDETTETRVSRIRLIEILRGSDAAAAALQAMA